MEKIDTQYVGPVQIATTHRSLQYSVTAQDNDDAQDLFIDAKERMLDVNSWNSYGAATDICFELTDKFGIPADRHAHKGDHIQMNTSDGRYYWALIEAIEYDDYPDTSGETIALHLQAVVNPQENADNTGISLKSGFTGRFVIERRGRVLMCICQGRKVAEENIVSANAWHNLWPTVADTEWKNVISSFIEAEKA